MIKRIHGACWKKLVKLSAIATIGIVSVILAAPAQANAASFSHAGQAGTPRAPHAGAAPAISSYFAIMQLENRITDRCLADDPKVHTEFCFPWQDNQQWGFTYDYSDAYGNLVGTLQNQRTGSCLDDSVYGLRGYFCHLPGDSSRIFQQFRLTSNGDHYVLQNMATGSCVDDSDFYGLRGYYCSSDDINHPNYFQQWRQFT